MSKEDFMTEIQKQIEVDFLKSKTYEEINDMFRQINTKFNNLKSELTQSQHDLKVARELVENLDKENQNLFNLLAEIHNHFSWKWENKTTSERVYMQECSKKLHESIDSKNKRKQALAEIEQKEVGENGR